MAECGLKILMLAPTPYFSDRGCHVRIYEEARTLVALGHDVRIITYHLGRDMPEIPVIRIPDIPWYSRLEAGPSWHKLYLDALLFIKATPVVLKFRPHIIHAHLHEGAFLGYILKKLAKVPLVFDYQGSLTGECIDHGFFPASSLAAKLFRFIEHKINGFADRIITSSSAGAAELINTWGTNPKKIVAVIDGVDTDVFQPYAIQEARQRLNISENMPVIAYLGVLNRYQGIDLLLDCISILKSKSVNAHFLIMGYPCEHYKTLAESKGLSSMISFTGKIDYKDAPMLLSAADIAITPKLSLTEANGKIYNYMACGLPVIAFDTPVNREALGDTGVYAKYGDAEDMAVKIIELLESPEERCLLAKLVRNKAVNDHSWKARGNLLVEVYRTAMGEK